MNTDSKLKLSILDQSPVRKGGNARQALLETTQLAQLAEQLGYVRFWVSEHHNIISLAGSTPEVLIAHLANHTQHIRLGSGGIMLPNHSALKVAENFRMLEALFPGRIDLGIGRAPGGDKLTAYLLNPSNNFNEQDFVQQLIDLQGFLSDDSEEGTIHEKIKAIPQAQTIPDLWILSSSGSSASVAGHFGMAFAFAHFINPMGGPQAVAAYRERFKPSVRLQTPQAAVAIFVLCADTAEKAAQLQAIMDYQMVRMEQGIINGFPSYEEIKNFEYTPAQLARIEYNRHRVVSGTPEQVKHKLETLAAQYGVDEVVAVTITHDFADRIRSYELLAEAFALQTYQPAEAEVS
ncbi:LLM class flavin-dependent oxidoreductase [Rhodocytophaga aerolata]|uniref:LLM class flavin-dependent oxidoreductase n=1 Tax=Rhodocytophaga aerolata TaxID=455078 RepID=A0ABT8REE7_9BACT|nr:LLM class flavin-dependent oxidoreductase [Rhodocytophaga aerolata]MDO1449110.1 LLM class flavin-dependent oxidoreductase [Rhodocytophaga aerolata]